MTPEQELERLQRELAEAKKKPESVKLVGQKSLKRRCDKEYRDFRKSPNG